jgi:nucleoid-associated protein YgaU
MQRRWCKSITLLVFSLSALVAAQAGAQIPATPLVLKTDAPDRYTVVRGDTLWGVSERFTDSPWRWPELWNFNREQIKNPHLIYPGDIVILDRALGRLSVARGEAPAEAEKAQAAERPPTGEVAPAPPAPKADVGERPPADTFRLSPRVRAERAEREEIPSIPREAIEPFLSRPLVVEPDGLDKGPTIVAAEEDRVMLGAGGIAYVRGIGKSTEDNWYVYRRGTPLVDPESNKTLGYEAVYLGTARVTRAGEPSTIQLTSVKQEVGIGDKLIVADRSQAMSYAPHAPTSPVSGRVMSIYGGLGKVGEAGPLSVITINRGKRDGVEVGHVLALYRYGVTVKDVSRPGAVIRVPDERYGLVFVFRVFERVSYALVMRITRPVKTLDAVQNP